MTKDVYSELADHLGVNCNKARKKTDESISIVFKTS